MPFLPCPVRGRPPHPDILTPAEWRVLEQLREGRSNAEIATALGVSVNTVRTHVSSMLAKLELRDRAHLASWGGEPAAVSRAALSGPQRTFLAGPFAWLRDLLLVLKPAGAVGAVVLVGAVIVGVAFASSRLGHGDPEADPLAALGTPPEGTPPPTQTPSPTASVLPSVTPTPRPTFTPSPGARSVSGLFSAPRRSTPDTSRSLPPVPPESFSAWNGTDVVLYDVEATTELNLGKGGLADFSADGRRLLWISGEVFARDDAGQRLWVMEIATGQRRNLGPARSYEIVDDTHIAVMLPGTNRWELIDTTTEERVARDGPPERESRSVLAEAAGFRLEVITTPQPYPYAYPALRLVDTSGRLPPLEFEALRTQLAPDGTLFLLTPPVDLRPQIGAFAGQGSWGISNVFEIDPTTGAATWIASAASSIPNSPFAAGARYVVWTENYCDISPTLRHSNGRTRIYDRDTKTLTELNQGLFVTALTPRGEMAVGTFGADALIDASSFAYRVRFRESDRAWSKDYRYAVVGISTGHEGVCGV